MRPVIPYLVVIALTAAAMFLLMRGCRSLPSRRQDKTAVDSLAKADSLYHMALLIQIDRLQGDSATQQDSIDNLMRQEAWYEAELSDQGDAIGQTVKTLDSVRIIHDTPRFVTACDTLENQVKQAKVEVRGYRILSDSLIAAITAQGRIKDSISQTWRMAYLHADTANAFLNGKYNSLYLDYTKLSKRSSFTGKVLGGAAAALLIGLILKK